MRLFIQADEMRELVHVPRLRFHFAGNWKLPNACGLSQATVHTTLYPPIDLYVAVIRRIFTGFSKFTAFDVGQQVDILISRRAANCHPIQYSNTSFPKSIVENRDGDTASYETTRTEALRRISNGYDDVLSLTSVVLTNRLFYFIFISPIFILIFG